MRSPFSSKKVVFLLLGILFIAISYYLFIYLPNRNKGTEVTDPQTLEAIAFVKNFLQNNKEITSFNFSNIKFSSEIKSTASICPNFCSTLTFELQKENTKSKFKVEADIVRTSVTSNFQIVGARLIENNDKNYFDIISDKLVWAEK